MGIRTLDFPKGKGSNTHVIIYVPSTIHITQRIPDSQFQKRIKDAVKFLRQTLGGSTRIAGIGNYYSDEMHQSVTEKVAKIESFTSKKAYYEFDTVIRDWLYKKVKQWDQESLSFQYNESLYFIKQKQ